MLVDAGFADVRVVEKKESREFIKDWLPGSGAEDYVVSANVTATNPSTKERSSVSLNESSESSTLATSAALAFGEASGASASASKRVGDAAAALVVALGGAIKSVGEHHARHTDETRRTDEECAPEPEPAKEKKAGC